MPRRSCVLATNEIYHIYNRSVGKEQIFTSKYLLNKALEVVDYYLIPQTIKFSRYNSLSEAAKQTYIKSKIFDKPLIEIYAYSFMPNHYHLLIKQLEDNGILNFMKNFQNSFAKFYNTRYDRHGSLFQNRFKAKRVEDNEQFIHVSRYIHLNPVTGYLVTYDKLADYHWTSYPLYQSNKYSSFINKKFLLSFFKDVEDHNNFVADQVDYQKSLSELKHLILD